MQNVAASVTFAGAFVRSVPPGEPFSVIVRQSVLPKQPTWVPVLWPGQNRPVAMLVLAGPVVSGERVTAIGPTCAPSQQGWFAPQGQLQGTQVSGATQVALVVHGVAGAAGQWPIGTDGGGTSAAVQSASVEHAVAPVGSPWQRDEQQLCPFAGCCPPGHGEARVPTPPVTQSRE